MKIKLKELSKGLEINEYYKTAIHIVNMGSISRCEKFGVSFRKKEINDMIVNEVDVNKFIEGDEFIIMPILRNRIMEIENQGRKI